MVRLGHPPPQDRYGRVLPAPPPADGPGQPDGDRMPGAVLAARILMWIQGGLGALAVLLVVAAVVVLVVMWESITGTSAADQGFVDALAGVGVLMLIIVVVVVALVAGTVVVGVTVPTLILAARFGSRRNGVRVGALVLEAIVGALSAVVGASNLVEANYAGGAACLLVAATAWTAFGLLLSPRAAAYFRS